MDCMSCSTRVCGSFSSSSSSRARATGIRFPLAPSSSSSSSFPASSHRRNPMAAAAPQSQFQPPLSAPLKSRLASGDRLYGAFLCSASPLLAEILGWSGYDFVVVDMEHGPGDTFAALPCLQALASTGTPSILRVADNDPVLVKKALDLGTEGIMIPMVDNPEAAAKAVAACRYPPRGIRGAAYPLVRASKFGIDPHYFAKCEQDLLIMVQIESKQAAECIQDIASVEGVDCIMMGPTDLSASLGLLHDPGNEEAKSVLRKAEEALLSGKSGAYLAGFAMPDDPPKDLHERGYHMVAGAVDVSLFRNAALADVKMNKPKLRNLGPPSAMS